jgi:hypothetical protein
MNINSSSIYSTLRNYIPESVTNFIGNTTSTLLENMPTNISGRLNDQVATLGFLCSTVRDASLTATSVFQGTLRGEYNQAFKNSLENVTFTNIIKLSARTIYAVTPTIDRQKLLSFILRQPLATIQDVSTAIGPTIPNPEDESVLSKGCKAAAATITLMALATYAGRSIYYANKPHQANPDPKSQTTYDTIFTTIYNPDLAPLIGAFAGAAITAFSEHDYSSITQGAAIGGVLHTGMSHSLDRLSEAYDKYQLFVSNHRAISRAKYLAGFSAWLITLSLTNNFLLKLSGKNFSDRQQPTLTVEFLVTLLLAASYFRTKNLLSSITNAGKIVAEISTPLAECATIYYASKLIEANPSFHLIPVIASIFYLYNVSLKNHVDEPLADDAALTRPASIDVDQADIAPAVDAPLDIDQTVIPPVVDAGHAAAADIFIVKRTSKKAELDNEDDGS